MWWYSIDPEQISIIDSKKFTLKMKKTKQVFMMMFFFIKIGQSAQVMLSGELTDFQDVVTTEKGLILLLHEAVMHYINMKNQKIPYRFLYNLFFCELRVLHKYLNDALTKS